MLFIKCIANLKGDSCTPDAVSSIVVQINAVVSTCVAQLQATAKVNLTGVDLTNLYVAIYGLLGVRDLKSTSAFFLSLSLNFSLSSRF